MLFHNITCYSTSLLSRIRVNTGETPEYHVHCGCHKHDDIMEVWSAGFIVTSLFFLVQWKMNQVLGFTAELVDLQMARSLACHLCLFHSWLQVKLTVQGFAQVLGNGWGGLVLMWFKGSDCMQPHRSSLAPSFSSCAYSAGWFTRILHRIPGGFGHGRYIRPQCKRPHWPLFPSTHTQRSIWGTFPGMYVILNLLIITRLINITAPSSPLLSSLCPDLPTTHGHWANLKLTGN